MKPDKDPGDGHPWFNDFMLHAQVSQMKMNSNQSAVTFGKGRQVGWISFAVCFRLLGTLITVIIAKWDQF